MNFIITKKYSSLSLAIFFCYEVYFFYPNDLWLLITAFAPFIFNVISDMIGLKTISIFFLY